LLPLNDAATVWSLAASGAVVTLSNNQVSMSAADGVNPSG
jgi:hypothetical protein